MKIAVVVPVYKVELHLRRCIDSILSQTHHDFELILVDDGSPDRSGAICDEYVALDSRVRALHQENGGLSAARNSGIEWVLENSSAEYITFVDSDDWLECDCLSEFARGAGMGADAVCLGHADVSDDGIRYCQYRDSGWSVVSPAEYFASDDYFARVSAWGKLYRTAWFSDIRYPVGRLMEDAFTTYRLLFCGKRIAMREKPCYSYYTGSSSILRSEWHPRKLYDAADAYDEAYAFFQKRCFVDLADWALRMKFTVFALALEPLARIDAEKAKDLRCQIDVAVAQGRLPFWRSRMLYKCLNVRFYKIRWLASMIMDFFSRGRRSWLIRESWPILCVTLKRRFRRLGR